MVTGENRRENVPHRANRFQAWWWLWLKFKSWLAHWREWGNIIFLFLTLEIAVLSIEKAQWITPQPLLTVVLIIAVLTGLVLAKSRLPTVVTYFIAVVLGAGIVIWQTSVLLPPLETVSKFNQFIAAFQYPWQIASLPQSSADNARFAAFIVFLTWIMGYVSTWFILRRQNAWIGISLGAIALLINLSNLSEEYYNFFLFYLLAAVLLVVQTNLISHHYRFKKQWFSYPKRGVILLLALVLCLSLLMISITWFTPEIRANRLENMVSAKMFWRTNIGNYVANYLTAVPAKQPFLESRQQDTLSFGSSFGRDDTIHFIRTSERPSYLRTRMYDMYTSSGWTNSNTAEHMLRETISSTEMEEFSSRSEVTYTVTTNLKTDILLLTGEFISSDIPASLQVLAPLSFDIDLVDSNGDHSLPLDLASLAQSLRAAQVANEKLSLNELKQFLPEDVKLTSIGADHSSPTEANYQLKADSDQLGTIEVTRIQVGAENTVAVITPYLLRPNQRYEVTVSISTATPAELSADGSDYPYWITDYYLQLPSTLPEYFKLFSESITREAKSPYDKVLAIKGYLSQFSYRSESEAPPEKVDGVSNFLFIQKSGNCVDFASAMAIILRAVGVPSRVCVGYLPGEWDAETGSSTIRAKHFHAWPEVYFPGYGWIEFEVAPFTGTEFEELFISSTGFSGDSEEDELLDEEEGYLVIGGDGVSRRKPGSSLPLVIFSVILLLVILTFTLKSLVSRWLRRFGEPDYASKVYGKMCFLASLARLGPGLQQTPVEYCTALTSVFPRQAGDLNNIAQAYVESRFSRRKELESMPRGRLYQSWCRVYPIILKRLFRMRH